MAQKTENKKTSTTIIDGKDLVLGRLGSVVAKKLLLGENVKIVNCKDIVILGQKNYLVERYKNKLSNKVVKQGPYYSRSPADMVRRSMRNMLPYKSKRGIEAMSRLRCYNSTPSILLNEEKTKVEEAGIDESSSLYFTRIGEICQKLGYNKGL